jgi:hypothetical protein
MISRAILIASCSGALLCSTACQPAPKQQEKAPLPPAAAQLVLKKLPDEEIERTYIDFAGKVQLIGYSVQPEKLAGPGTPLHVKLYWRVTQPLDPGWNLFTHLLTPSGGQLANLDHSGPLRQAKELAPDQWEPGFIYVDELRGEVPKTQPRNNTMSPLYTPSFTVAVGFHKTKQDPVPKRTEAEEKKEVAEGETQPPERPKVRDFRLPVVSGPSDNQQRALVATLSTGIRPAPQLQAKAEAEDNEE